MRAFHRDPLAFLGGLRDRFGPLAHFRLGPWNFLLASGPESSSTVLKQIDVYAKGPGLTRDNPLIGRGLLTEEGNDWIAERRAIAPIFRPRQVEQWLPDMEREVAAWGDSVVAPDLLDIHQAMLQLTLRVAARTLFGSHLEDDPDLLSETVEGLMDHFYRRIRTFIRIPYHWPWPFQAQYKARAAMLRGAIDRLFEETHGISVFKSKAHPHFYDHALTYLIAGHETTGNALTWTLWLLSQHPEIQVGIRAEVEKAHGASHPKDLPLTIATLHEALRLYPPVWLLSRTATQATTLEGHPVPQGTHVLISPWVTHRDPKLFTHPLDFDPERWLTGAPFPYAYMPFGAGPRACIGQDFASQEAVVVLGAILRRWHLVPGPEPELFPGLTLKPKRSVLLKVRPV